MAKPPVFRILIDTTELYFNPRMDGPIFSLLTSFVNRTESCLIVPQIVVDETINHFRMRLEKAISDANGKVREIVRLIASELPVVPDFVETETQKYKEFLTSKLKHMGAKSVSYDCVSVERLAARALRRQKPFDGEGKKGFRDAIVWEALLSQISPEGDSAYEYVFVSNNSKDFGDKEPYSDLQADLERICSGIRLRLYSRLSDFVDECVKPHLTQLDELATEIEVDGFKDFSLGVFFYDESDAISDELRKFQHWYGLTTQLEARTGFQSFNSCRLEKDCDRFDVVDTWLVDQNSIVVGVDFEVLGTVDCLEKTQAYYGDRDQLGIYEVDEDRQINIRLKVMMVITLSDHDGEVLDFEVSDFDLLSWARST